MREIGADELKAKLESGDAVEVVDIREADEFASWHIAGSSNLPVYDALRMNDQQALVSKSAELPKDRSIVTVCRAGIISQRAAQVLESLGYQAMSLNGGLRGWGGVWSEAVIPLGEGRT